jgi:putative transcriptional regulator
MKDKSFDYLNITYNNVPPAAGKLLLAEPFSEDPFFRKTVVLLTEYSKGGAVGFILNKPLKITTDDLMESGFSGTSEVCFGGPVGNNTLHYIHNLSGITGAIEVLPGIYWSGDQDELKMRFSDSGRSGNYIRFFLGYSGWSGSQLEQEMKNHAWIVADPEVSALLQISPGLWEDTLRSMGGKYSLWANFPDDPADN